MLLAVGCQPGPDAWTAAELQLIRSLWIENLPAVPSDPSNRVADDPRAAELGRRLFFDTRLSGNGAVSCATCHQPARRFTDGLPRSKAIGTTRRNAPSLIGVGYSPWLYWDGRRDSLWSQALTPLEDPNEHGGNRVQYARLLMSDAAYRQAYEGLFGELPDLPAVKLFPTTAGSFGNEAVQAAWQALPRTTRQQINLVFANLGKAIAAYERLLLPGQSRFDAYVDALVNGEEVTGGQRLQDNEIRGLRLFIDEAQCLRCHNGPLFTNNEFHNTGVISAAGQIPDKGRIQGIREVQADPFNCLGQHSDAGPDDCAELRFARSDAELLGAVRTPSLRNLNQTGPFMHSGQIQTLAAVLDHYNRAPDAMVGHNEAEPLGLSRRQLKDLEAFLLSLAAEPATPGELLRAADGT